MQEKYLFEYAIIRVVPRVEREEFMNVGVILYCSSQHFLQIKFQLTEKRLHAFTSEIDMVHLRERLQAFEKVCAASVEGGPIATLPIASRFRWLTATRSTVIQTSQVHPGLCVDANEALGKLFIQLVQ